MLPTTATSATGLAPILYPSWSRTGVLSTRSGPRDEMALLNSHTVINTLLIAGAAFLALMLLRLVLRATLRIFSVGCLAMVGVALIVGVARWGASPPRPLALAPR